MGTRITLKVILEHIQASKNELQQQIALLHAKVSEHDKRFDYLERRVTQGFEDVRVQMEDARLHRQALQEDLEETMRVQIKQGRLLSRIQAT